MNPLRLTSTLVASVCVAAFAAALLQQAALIIA